MQTKNLISNQVAYKKKKDKEISLNPLSLDYENWENRFSHKVNFESLVVTVNVFM